MRRAGTIVAIHQPNFAPYLGFFHKMMLADVFILYDTAQFSKNDFQNRNRIKTPRGPHWLTVPVRHPSRKEIRDVEVDTSVPWARRHLESLSANYARAPHFATHMAKLESILQKDWPRLVQLNETLISLLQHEFGIPTDVRRASEFRLDRRLSPSEKLAELTRRAGGTAYLSGPGGPDYLKPEEFAELPILLQEFQHPTYPQLWGPFVLNLSALDLLLNAGGESGRFLEKCGGSRLWRRRSDSPA